MAERSSASRHAGDSRVAIGAVSDGCGFAIPIVALRSSGIAGARDRLVAVGLVSRERTQKAKALVRTEPCDAVIWLLPASSGSLALSREPT